MNGSMDQRGGSGRRGWAERMLCYCIVVSQVLYGIRALSLGYTYEYYILVLYLLLLLMKNKLTFTTT